MEQSDAGFFGKIPGVGDFVRRRLPGSFVEPWDRWLTLMMSVWQERLGEPRWQELFSAGPLWQFVLTPCVCGPSGYMGVIGPSADRIGRRFPLAIVRVLTGKRLECEAALEEDSWFTAAAVLHRRVREDASVRAQQLDGYVRMLPQTLGARCKCDQGPVKQALADGAKLPVHALLPISGQSVVPYLQALWRLGSDRPVGLWWTMGSRALPASAIVDFELPKSLLFLAAGSIDSCGFSDVAFTQGRSRGDAPGAAGASSSEPRTTVSGGGCGAEILPQTLEGRRRSGGNLERESSGSSSLVSRSFGRSAQRSGGPEEELGEPACERGGPEERGHRIHVVFLRREECGLYLLVAGPGRKESGGSAVSAIADVVTGIEAGDLMSSLHGVRVRLLELHSSLRRESLGDTHEAADYSLIALRIVGTQASLLRCGSANAWLQKGSSVVPLLTTEAQSAVDGGRGDGSMDTGWERRSASGVGGRSEPVFDESICIVRPLDRILLGVTPALVKRPRSTLLRCMSADDEQETYRRIAAVLGLRPGENNPCKLIQIE